MAWTIRPTTTDDVPAIVGVLNTVLPPAEHITEESFRFDDGMLRPDEAFTRLVALEDAALVAVGQAQNSHTRPRHRFTLTLAVHPASRRRGVGTELERRLRGFAAASGGTELTAIIKADDAVSRRFLEHRSYREAYQRFEMELNVSEFDWKRFEGWRARLGGLRLLSMAELGGTEHNLRKMFELAMQLARDVPHPEGAAEFTMEDFQQFSRMPGFRPEGLFIVTDDDRFVGLSGVMTVEGRPAYTYFTGVDRAYRGRGLATLLKLATIEFVQGLGIPAMRTSNDTVNSPMVAVNEKLGYRRLPARVAMKLHLGAGS